LLRGAFFAAVSPAAAGAWPRVEAAKQAVDPPTIKLSLADFLPQALSFAAGSRARSECAMTLGEQPEQRTMRIRALLGARLGTAAMLAGASMLPAAASAQTAQPAQPAPTTPAPTTAAAPTREALQQQLDAQNAKNEALRQRIAKLEDMLKTDVCNNPEAEALLKAEQQAPPR
jgi:cell division protein FtsB